MKLSHFTSYLDLVSMNAAHAGDDNQKESLASLLTDTPSVSAESITAWLSRVAAEAEAPSLASAISKLSEHSTSSTPCPKSKKRRLSNSEAPSETPPITTKRQRNFPEDLPVNIIGNVTPSSQVSSLYCLTWPCHRWCWDSTLLLLPAILAF